MKETFGRFLKFGCALFIGALICHSDNAQAGWSGLINGVGKGWAGVNVRSAAAVTNRVMTLTNTLNPSAAMKPTIGYGTNAPLPFGSATNTYARIKGATGGFWQMALKAGPGDGTDHAEIDRHTFIIPADCAELEMESYINQTQAQINANGNSGTITVNAKGTAGTAIWLRGYEMTGSMEDVPADDPDTVDNESVEYLKLNALLRFETFMVGPFEFGGTNGNSCPLIIPFNLTSGDLEKLVIAADGIAKALPMAIQCPPGVLVSCTDPIYYPGVTVAGCGNITVSYSPPLPAAGFFAPGTFPVGVTAVTATATDEYNNSTNCTFTVTVVDNVAPVAPVLPALTNESSVQVPTPVAIDICGSTTNSIPGTTTDPTLYNTQGTFTVNWRFADSYGNVSTATQTVIVDDVTAPVAPTLPDVIGECGAGVTVTAPTAQDNVAGTVTGTTTSPLTYTAPGTNIIVWTFNDNNGNTSTATQKVIITGLEFHGFYSPIGGSGGGCDSPFYTANTGSKIPVKFDVSCGGTSYTSGMPTLSIEKSNNQCTTLTSVSGGNFALVGNEWHFNWNTSGLSKGTYKLTANLQDGTKRSVWIKLK